MDNHLRQAFAAQIAGPLLSAWWKENAIRDEVRRLETDRTWGLEGSFRTLKEVINRYGQCVAEFALATADAIMAECQTDGVRIFRDGDQWCAVYPDFVNLQESLAGFGDTPAAARKALLRDIPAH